MCISTGGRLERTCMYSVIIIFQMFYDYMCLLHQLLMFQNKCHTLVAVIVNSCKLTLRFFTKTQWIFIH
jgi:hypothetical protein